MSVQKPILASEKCDLEMHAAVKMVAEFMRANLPWHKCVAIARGVAQVAPLLWGDRQPGDLEVLSLNTPGVIKEDFDGDEYLGE